MNRTSVLKKELYSRMSRALHRPRPGADFTPSAAGKAAKKPSLPLPAWSSFEPLPRQFFWIWLFAAIIRLLLFNKEGFWWDEIDNYYNVLKTPSWKSVLDTAHIPYFFMARAAVEIWDSIAAVRLVSALWGIALFPVIYWLGRRFTSREFSLWICAAFAISPYHLHYSLCSTYYTGPFFWSALSLLLALRYCEDGNPVDFLLTLLALIVNFFFHPFNGIFVVTGSLTLFAAMAIRPNYLARMNPSAWLRGKHAIIASVLWVFYMLTALAIGIFLFKGRGLLRTAWNALEFGATPRNYASYHLILFDYFRAFLADYPIASQLPVNFAWPLTVIAGAGLIAALRRRPWFAILFLSAFLTSYILIHNFKPDHHFYIRYFSFTYPMLLILMILGVMQWGLWARSLRSHAPAEDDPAFSSCVSSRAIVGILCGIALYLAGIAFGALSGWAPVHSLRIAAWSLGLILLGGFAVAGILGLSSRKIAQAMMLCIFALYLAVEVNRFVLHDGGNWKNAVAHWKKEARKDQWLFWEIPPELNMLNYFIDQTPLDPNKRLRVPSHNAAAEMRKNFIKGLSRILPDFWYVRCWNVNTDNRDIPWCDAHLETAVNAPSNYDPIMDLKVYRGRIQDHFLQPPYGLRISYRDEERMPAASSPSAHCWERTVDVDETATWTVTLDSPQNEKGGIPDDSRIAIRVDGKEFASWPEIRSRGIGLAAGKHKLGAIILDTGRNAGGGAPSAIPPIFHWNTLALPSGSRFSARNVTIPFLAFCEATEYQGRPALHLIRNLGVEYWLDFPAAGTYEIGVEAVHDKGHWDRKRPVWLALSLDQQFQGILEFAQADNSWDTRRSPLEIRKPGMHILAINLVSAGPAKWNLPPDEETNAILGRIEIRSTAKERPARDERMVLRPGAPDGGRQPVTQEILLQDPKDGAPLPGWIHSGDSGQPIVVQGFYPGSPGGQAVQIEIPAKSNSVYWISPPRPVIPGSQAVQAHARLGCLNLINHSVTLGIVFFGADSTQFISGSQLFGQESVFQSAAEKQFAAIAAIPSQARSYALLVHCFPNGSRPAVSPGEIRIASPCLGE